MHGNLREISAAGLKDIGFDGYAIHLNTIHNLHYYQELMKDIREAIENDRFDHFVKEFYSLRGE